MNRFFCVLGCFLIAGCAGWNGGGVDRRNFAIDTYYPAPNEARLAETYAKNYWAQHGSRPGSGSPYLAVDASLIFPNEVQDLWSKLINSETTASVFAHGTQDFSLSDFVLYGIVIFDTRTGRLVSDQGYVVADLPDRGRIKRFGDYFARYIGSAP
ncbi:MAG: hypothetical protein JO069_11775 [Verrucomicrobia bacterium]|nr:hypothetical protein [Verrucomicrobiota bacterium]